MREWLFFFMGLFYIISVIHLFIHLKALHYYTIQ